VIDTALGIQTRLAELMPNTGNYGWYVVGAVMLIAAAMAWGLRSRNRALPARSDPETSLSGHQKEAMHSGGAIRR
jgi:hypothetical protein